MTIADIRRPRPPHRPWLANTAWDILMRASVMHIDLYAYESDGLVYVIEYRLAGRDLVARDCYRVEGDMLAALPDFDAGDAHAVMWNADNARTMARAHKALMGALDAREAVTGERRQTVLCHYIPRPDHTPWPRATLNVYKARTVTPALPALPDIL